MSERFDKDGRAADWLEDWKNLRTLIQHEDSLVNNRLVWMLTFNGFLFTAFGLSLGPEATVITSVCNNERDFSLGVIHCVRSTEDSHLIRQAIYLRLALALSGIGSAWAALVGIAAAFSAMYSHERAFLHLHGKNLTGFYVNPISAREAMIAGNQGALLMPSILIGTWLFVLGLIAISSMRSIQVFEAQLISEYSDFPFYRILVLLIFSVCFSIVVFQYFSKQIFSRGRQDV